MRTLSNLLHAINAAPECILYTVLNCATMLKCPYQIAKIIDLTFRFLTRLFTCLLRHLVKGALCYD